MKIPKRAFVFLRHGETEFNLEGRFQGRLDVPLNDTGTAQAQSAVSILADQKISRIVSSPARRVRETIQPFLDSINVPLHVEDDLMEFFFGSFEGRKMTTIRQELGVNEEVSWLSILPHDAECWSEFSTKVCSAVER